MNIHDVLRDEMKAVLGAKVLPDDAGLYCALNGSELAALCLSGGGIRSAAFALGLIQALATHPRQTTGARVAQAKDSLLAKFHFLSTVSGGGYIGSCLSAWIARTSYQGVWKDLVGRPRGPDVEPKSLSWLRDYSSYLTPKTGMASADTWTAIALSIRNLILNWFVLLPLLCLAVLVMDGIALLMVWLGKYPTQPTWNGLLLTCLAGGTLLLITALRFSTRNRPTRGPSRANQTTFLVWDLARAVLAYLLFCFALAQPSMYILVRELPNCEDLSTLTCVASTTGVGSILGAIVWALAWAIALPKRNGARDFLGDLVAWIFAGGVYGALMALGVYLYGISYGSGFWIFKSSEVLLLVFGIPWALSSQLFAQMIFVGLTSFETDSDLDREWLGRAAGWYLVTGLGILILAILVFVGSDLAVHIGGAFKQWLGPLGMTSGGITAWLGKSSWSPARGQAQGMKGISVNAVLAIAAPIFAALLIILAAALLDTVLFHKPLTSTGFWVAQVDPDGNALPWPHEATLVVMAIIIVSIVGAGASRFINVNRFSMHAMYRNRIVRAFLGASNPTRAQTTNPFTDFDAADNLRMHLLWKDQQTLSAVEGPVVATETWRPFHIINAALNVVSAKKLAWQQRKAEPFTVSPLHSGSSCLGYRASVDYGDPKGISLGTAVAISGAAASPNMGYHSSPPLAFLLTLLNVRLGWWLGNPGPKGDKTYTFEGPRFAAKPLVMEMLGLTTDQRRYVYLSDGGHFENLGLYEMVRRRCRFIVVSDAGCDPDFAFEDLGNAVRKISLDLGVTIEFNGLTKLLNRADANAPGRRKVPRATYAIGRVGYAAADGAGSVDGIILYIKPTFYQDEIRNAGVRNYAAANPQFPQQGTGNQWFDEPQFESYRALGFEIMDNIIGTSNAPGAPPAGINGLLAHLATTVGNTP